LTEAKIEQLSAPPSPPLLARAPERLHEEIAADYNDIIYAATREEIEAQVAVQAPRRRRLPSCLLIFARDQC
jgi:hypothetical protein